MSPILPRANRRVQEIQDASVDGNTGLDITTIYLYDILGRLIKLTDSNASETVWQYDAAGRQVVKVYDNGDTILMEYDLKGRLTKRTDPNGVDSVYSYNNRDLLTQRSYGVAGVQTYSYDNLRRLTQSTDNNSGNLLVVRDTSYDALGRVLTEAQTIGALPTRTTVNTWDAAGRKLTCTHPNGRVVRYAWTKLNQPDTIETDTGAGFEVICDYDYQYDTPGNGDKRPLLQAKALHAGTGVVAHYTVSVTSDPSGGVGRGCATLCPDGRSHGAAGPRIRRRQHGYREQSGGRGKARTLAAGCRGVAWQRSGQGGILQSARDSGLAVSLLVQADHRRGG